MQKITKTRVLIILYTPLDYIMGYFKHKKSKNLNDYYKKSYNRFFLDILKELWATGKSDTSKYVIPNRPITPRLRRK